MKGFPDQSGRERAMRRGAGAHFFRPPAELCSERKWHLIQTADGVARVQWRCGIDVWHSEAGARLTAEWAYHQGWKYIGLSPDQSGGRP